MKILFSRNWALKMQAVDDDGNVVARGVWPDSYGTTAAQADITTWAAKNGLPADLEREQVDNLDF